MTSEETPVYEILRHLRERAGLSLRAVAIETGINRGRLSAIERGLFPTAAELDAIAAAIEALEAAKQ